MGVFALVGGIVHLFQLSGSPGSSEVLIEKAAFQVPPKIRVEKEFKKVNVNQAGVEDLIRVKGIGPATAKKILKDRQKNGPFKNLKSLGRVKGIGPKSLKKMSTQLEF